MHKLKWWKNKQEKEVLVFPVSGYVLEACACWTHFTSHVNMLKHPYWRQLESCCRRRRLQQFWGDNSSSCVRKVSGKRLVIKLTNYQQLQWVWDIKNSLAAVMMLGRETTAQWAQHLSGLCLQAHRRVWSPPVHLIKTQNLLYCESTCTLTSAGRWVKITAFNSLTVIWAFVLNYADTNN